MIRAPRLSMACIHVISAVAVFCVFGCNASKTVTEVYQRPAAINMAGRETVRFDGLSGVGADSINGRLKSALQARGFTIVDRGASLAARRAEDELRQVGLADSTSESNIATAAVQIRGQVMRHDFVPHIEDSIQTSNGVQYRVYKCVGIATVEASFDVTDLKTTQIIASQPIKSQQKRETDYYPQPPSISPSEALEACYNEIAERFLHLIAPYEVRIEHAVFPVKELPATNAGIAMLHSDPKAAITEFQSAIAAAPSLPKVQPKTIAMCKHNLGVAYEMSRNFEQPSPPTPMPLDCLAHPTKPATSPAAAAAWLTLRSCATRGSPFGRFTHFWPLVGWTSPFKARYVVTA